MMLPFEAEFWLTWMAFQNSKCFKTGQGKPQLEGVIKTPQNSCTFHFKMIAIALMPLLNSFLLQHAVKPASWLFFCLLLSSLQLWSVSGFRKWICITYSKMTFIHFFGGKKNSFPISFLRRQFNVSNNSDYSALSEERKKSVSWKLKSQTTLHLSGFSNDFGKAALC